MGNTGSKSKKWVNPERTQSLPITSRRGTVCSTSSRSQNSHMSKLSVVSSTLTKYAGRTAIQQVLQREFGDRVLAYIDGKPHYRWWILESADGTKVVYAERKLTVLEEQEIYNATNRSRTNTNRRGTEWDPSAIASH